MPTGDTPENAKESRLARIKGHLYDAHAHAVSQCVQEDLIGTPEEVSGRFLDRIAVYLSSCEEVLHEPFEEPYHILKKAARNALDVRDESGARLGEYKFENSGIMRNLQEILQNALCDSDKALDSDPIMDND